MPHIGMDKCMSPIVLWLLWLAIKGHLFKANFSCMLCSFYSNTATWTVWNVFFLKKMAKLDTYKIIKINWVRLINIQRNHEQSYILFQVFLVLWLILLWYSLDILLTSSYWVYPSLWDLRQVLISQGFNADFNWVLPLSTKRCSYQQLSLLFLLWLTGFP